MTVMLSADVRYTVSFAAGKRIIITGGNSGIGFETARNLSREAKEIILVCRSRERAEQAKETLTACSPRAAVSVFIADLSSPDSIRKAAEALGRTYDSIDILINNAGGVFFRRKETVDGLEYTFGLNHMGYFRFTMGILPLLEASGNARVLNVSSLAHEFAAMNFDDLQHERSYRGFIVYARSKLANILFTRELARRTDPGKITTAAFHPGLIKSNFAGDTGRTVDGVIFHAVALVFGETPETGAVTPTYAAREPEILNGGYYANRRLIRPSRHALDDEAAKKLWEISEALA